MRETSAVLESPIRAFLNYCRVEKGLTPNSLDAYRRDLVHFAASPETQAGAPDLEGLRRYVDALFRQGLASPSIARRIATLRGFYRFLVSEGRIPADPPEHLRSPTQCQNLPKFLTRAEIERLRSSPDPSKPPGLRDRAMLE
ncbi:MAG: site-specific integrase, partial [Bryobacteraceae bacterium]